MPRNPQDTSNSSPERDLIPFEESWLRGDPEGLASVRRGLDQFRFGPFAEAIRLRLEVGLLRFGEELDHLKGQSEREVRLGVKVLPRGRKAG